jgi:L-ascorbate metabolism protein UlaG (beta-lactamase superfamily)
LTRHNALSLCFRTIFNKNQFPFFVIVLYGGVMIQRFIRKYLLTPASMAWDGGAALRTGRQAINPYYQGQKSDHFDGIRFFVPSLPGVSPRKPKGWGDFLYWQLREPKAPWPDSRPSPFLPAKPALRSEKPCLTFIGHASFLLQVAGLNLLIDPVFAQRASPVPFAGPRRVNPPGIVPTDMPPIDAILITHNHYDHLDLDSVSRFGRGSARILTPWGNDTLIRDYDDSLQVEAGDWGDAFTLSDMVSVHLLPCQHWSARWLNDRRMALWCAFLIRTPWGDIVHIGDTGYGDGSLFRAIARQFGSPRLVLLPIGAYAPRWFLQDQHIDPFEAVAILNDLGAEQALGHHWGTFRLTNEPIGEPPALLNEALARHSISPERFLALHPGQIWQG